MNLDMNIYEHINIYMNKITLRKINFGEMCYQYNHQCTNFEKISTIIEFLFYQEFHKEHIFH